MAIGLEGQKLIVAEVNAAATRALSAVVADSRGVTVANMTALRKEARENGVYVRVVRNTLAKRAVEGTNFACLQDAFVGPSIIAFSSEHPGTGARLFKIFAEKNDQFEVRALAYEGDMIEASQIDILASLPTYDEAISRLMNVIKGATTKLAWTLAVIRDQKEQEAA